MVFMNTMSPGARASSWSPRPVGDRGRSHLGMLQAEKVVETRLTASWTADRVDPGNRGSR